MVSDPVQLPISETRIPETLSADYLVIGSGAVGMAFVDSILTDSLSSVVIVDRHERPGGHWNDGYPFLRLQSPSMSYGVNSRPLGGDSVDYGGFNRGMHECASAQEICAYFDDLMRERFLSRGSVRYFPRCEYAGDGSFTSLASGEQWRVRVSKRIVDATIADTAVPSTHAPRYEVAPGVQCIAPNTLPRLARDASDFVVIGAGKTGIDACLWLLDHGISPARICWIMPQDAWLIDRLHTQAGDEFLVDRAGAIARQLELIREARSIDELFRLLNNNGQLLRIDDSITPTKYRCATVSRAELVALRSITNIVRLGRVQRIEPGRTTLERGSIATSAGSVHINCASSGFAARETVPVFQPGRINLQMVRTCQPCLSAALIGHVEATVDDDKEKNMLCAPVPPPKQSIDWLRMYLVSLQNQYRWSRNADLRAWLANSRLDVNRRGSAALSPCEEAILKRIRDSVAAATANLEALLQSEQ
jgi:hypothetical protein